MFFFSFNIMKAVVNASNNKRKEMKKQIDLKENKK